MKELIAVIITLGLVAWVVTQQSPRDTMQALPELPHFTVQDVASLSILSKGKVVLSAKREGKAWIVADSDKPVYLQAAAIEQLLGDLQAMRVKRVVSRHPGTFARFSVLDTQVILKDKAGHVLLDVFVGKPATDLRRTYIRLPDKHMVVTVDKVLTWQVKRTQDAWLEPKPATKDNPTE